MATGKDEKFTYSQAVTLFPTFFCFLVGTIKNKIQQKE
jgi:hypothetical protein